MLKLSFAEWLQKQEEMTSTASTGGGGTFTNDIANFSRRLFEKPVERQWADDKWADDKKKKKIKEAYGQPENFAQQTQPQPQQQQQPQMQLPQQAQKSRSMQGQGFHFKGTGTSQQLYNQGFQAFQKLAQRQPKFANAINSALQQLKSAFLKDAQSRQGIKAAPDNTNSSAYNDDDFEDAVNSMRGAF